jgi:hypothetical protein
MVIVRASRHQAAWAPAVPDSTSASALSLPKAARKRAISTRKSPLISVCSIRGRSTSVTGLQVVRRSRTELANALFEYPEIIHNRQRRQSSLGKLTPVGYEVQRRRTTTAT